MRTIASLFFIVAVLSGCCPDGRKANVESLLVPGVIVNIDIESFDVGQGISMGTAGAIAGDSLSMGIAIGGPAGMASAEHCNVDVEVENSKVHLSQLPENVCEEKKVGDRVQINRVIQTERNKEGKVLSRDTKYLWPESQ